MPSDRVIAPRPEAQEHDVVALTQTIERRHVLRGKKETPSYIYMHTYACKHILAYICMHILSLFGVHAQVSYINLFIYSFPKQSLRVWVLTCLL